MPGSVLMALHILTPSALLPTWDLQLKVTWPLRGRAGFEPGKEGSRAWLLLNTRALPAHRVKGQGNRHLGL